MEQNQSFDELMAQGQESLQAGDKTRAHGLFEKATQLYPGEVSAWLLRAETAPDAAEATECYERVVALDPQNAQARQKLLDQRLNTLQESAKAAPTPKPSLLSSRWLRAILLTVGALLVTVAVGCLVYYGFTQLTLARETTVAQAPVDIPPLDLPATWTPIPTRTPTGTPTGTPTDTETPRPTAGPPTATPVIGWATITNLNVRAGPGVGYQVLAVLDKGAPVAAVGRISDATWLQIDYIQGKRLAWVARAYVSVTDSQVSALPVISGIPVASQPTSPPPTAVPARQAEFILGRPAEFSADCGKPWRVLGTVYDSQAGSQRLNGVLVRVWAFNQLQGTVSSGSSDPRRVGYWEWTFNRGSDVTGQVAVVNPDGSLRSDPINFQLTGKCDGSSATNQVILDFVGR